jgi:hypothetical protein
MANNIKVLFLGQIVGGNVQPVTTGAYDLRVSPYSTAGISGASDGYGGWLFIGLSSEADYKLYDTGTGLEVTRFCGGGSNTVVFFDSDLATYLKLTGGTMTGNVAFGGTKKLTGLAAGSTAGDSVRYEQVAKLAVNETINGLWTFGHATRPQMDDVIHYPPTSDEDIVDKCYVDTLFAQSASMIQSTYLVKCLTTQTAESRFSYLTMEKCNAYLAALTDIATLRGTIIIEPTAGVNSSILVDDGTSQWCSAGVDIWSPNKSELTRQAANNSLTCDSRLTNLYINDDEQVLSRTYINFTFQDCDFKSVSTNMVFTSCKFLGINRGLISSGTVTMSNCTGTAFWTNATVTATGTQVIDLRDKLDTANLGI